jgi:hypothetical protein
MRWFKIWGDKWLLGSTRYELTAEQRAVWIDLLAKASKSKVLGQINFYSLEQLAQQFNISLELLENTIKRCVEEKKIKFFSKKRKILILNWKEYQSEYQRQRPYRQQLSGQSKVTKMEHRSCNKVTRRKEGEIEEKRLEGEGEDILENIKKENKSFPTHPRDQFLYILEEFSKKYLYPFDKKLDGLLFDQAIQKWRNVDPIRELERKIDWWGKNPRALKTTGKDPRQQLMEFFEKEAKYQSGDINQGKEPKDDSEEPL